ncbi:MAG: hypothetical protein ABI091_26525 [Ferruginibacter sp.]
MTYQQPEFNFDNSKKRKHSATSKAAHESVKEHKEVFYDKIISALERLKVGGTAEEVAKEAGIEYCQCHKRLPELVDIGKVFNTGITRPNSSGRKAMVRQLVNHS